MSRNISFAAMFEERRPGDVVYVANAAQPRLRRRRRRPRFICVSHRVRSRHRSFGCRYGERYARLLRRFSMAE